MKICVNGEHREVEDSIRLEEFLRKLGVNKQGIAVELNRQVIGKEVREDIFLKSGDQLEIVQFVGGGS